MILFLLLTLGLFVILADAAYDYIVIKQGKQIYHIGSLIFPVAMYLIVSSMLLTLEWEKLETHIPDFITVSIVLPFLRWTMHDTLLNKWRNLPSDYLGVGPNSAYTDRFLLTLKEKFGLHPDAVRVIFLAISILIAFVIQLINYELTR